MIPTEMEGNRRGWIGRFLGRLSPLTKLGAVYGALWFLPAALVKGMVDVDGWNADKLLRVLLVAPLGCFLGMPAGIVVTHIFAPRLRHASWGRLLWLAPQTLLVGTLVFGLTWGAIAWMVALTMGTDAGWGVAGPAIIFLPLVCAYAAFLTVWPLGLSVLNCWHLRGRVSR